MSKTRLTQAGCDRLQARLTEFKEKRSKLRAEVGRARSEGDLNENAGYHAAREALAVTEFQIRTLEFKIRDAIIVENGGAAEVAEMGTTITLRDLDTEAEVTYRLGEPEESDGLTPMMTPNSPLGKAVLGKKIDEIIELNGPRGAKRFMLIGIVEE